jgi:hypothetical protein
MYLFLLLVYLYGNIMLVHTHYFLLRGGGVVCGGDREAVYNLCLILKIMLHKSCLKYNYMFHDSHI